MKNLVAAVEAEQLQAQKKEVPRFSPGDTVVVRVRVKEGDRERLQAFEGVVIAKRNRGLRSSFTVRKISHGEGVERVFQTYSSLVSSITVKRRGDVRRAKLYYLRDRTGKSARIKEKLGAILRETTKQPEEVEEITAEMIDTGMIDPAAEQVDSAPAVNAVEDNDGEDNQNQDTGADNQETKDT